MVQEADIPDAKLYRPVFNPCAVIGEFTELHRIVQPYTLVSEDRCHVLYQLARQALYVEGDFWECGVYKGGTAALLTEVIRRHDMLRTLHLFDTFSGMPETDASRDVHERGDFSDTSLNAVRALVGSDQAVFHAGLIPDTFTGFEGAQIAFAHVDVDLYRSVLDCCRFIFPRMSVGGFMVFDDYGFPKCPGARAAVDEFFGDTKAFPLVLSTGQALVFKGP